MVEYGDVFDGLEDLPMHSGQRCVSLGSDMGFSEFMDVVREISEYIMTEKIPEEHEEPEEQEKLDEEPEELEKLDEEPEKLDEEPEKLDEEQEKLDEESEYIPDEEESSVDIPVPKKRKVSKETKQKMNIERKKRILIRLQNEKNEEQRMIAQLRARRDKQRQYAELQRNLKEQFEKEKVRKQREKTKQRRQEEARKRQTRKEQRDQKKKLIKVCNKCMQEETKGNDAFFEQQEIDHQIKIMLENEEKEKQRMIAQHRAIVEKHRAIIEEHKQEKSKIMDIKGSDDTKRCRLYHKQSLILRSDEEQRQAQIIKNIIENTKKRKINGVCIEETPADKILESTQTVTRCRIYHTKRNMCD